MQLCVYKVWCDRHLLEVIRASPKAKYYNQGFLVLTCFNCDSQDRIQLKIQVSWNINHRHE